MTKVKAVPIDAVFQSTKLKDVHGIGPVSLLALSSAGYGLKRNSTVGDFRKATGSYQDLEASLKTKGVQSKYVLSKFRWLWTTAEPDTQDPPNPPSAVEQPKTPTETKDELHERKNESFLLEPQPVPGEPNTSSNPDLVTNSRETPSVDAQERHSDPTKIVAKGFIAPKEQPFVIPDQTVTISPDDQDINKPMEVLPNEPVPINPAIAIGPAVHGVRMVPPKTLEEKQAELLQGNDLPAFKANAEKDIGGDGSGQPMIQSARIGVDAPRGEWDGDSVMGGSFEAIPMAPVDVVFDEDEPIRQQNFRNASSHPFKQKSLFRDHDAAMQYANIIDDSIRETKALGRARRGAVKARDLTWYKYNAPTEGVDTIMMPRQASNFLNTDRMISDYQLHGARSLRMVHPPSPFETERMIGRFK